MNPTTVPAVTMEVLARSGADTLRVGQDTVEWREMEGMYISTAQRKIYKWRGEPMATQRQQIS